MFTWQQPEYCRSEHRESVQPSTECIGRIDSLEHRIKVAVRDGAAMEGGGGSSAIETNKEQAFNSGGFSR